MSGIEAQYARLLRWYPRAWRARNEAAVLGALLDQSDDTGRMTPSAAERASLILGGLRTRLRAVAPPAMLLTMAMAFLTWYLAVIEQSFAHSSLVTLGVLALALGATIAELVQLARTLSVIAALSAVVLTVTGAGTGPSPATLLVVLILASLVPYLRRRDAVALAMAAFLAGYCSEEIRTAASTWPVVFAAEFWLALAIAMATGAGAVVLSAATVASRVSTRGEPAP